MGKTALGTGKNQTNAVRWVQTLVSSGTGTAAFLPPRLA